MDEFQEVSQEQKDYIAAKRALLDLENERENIRRELESVVKMRKASLARGVGVNMWEENSLTQKIKDMDKQIEQAKARQLNAKKKWQVAIDQGYAPAKLKPQKLW